METMFLKEKIMKKILILSFILIVGVFLPSFATCPIDEGATVCSVPGFREKVPPIYNPSSHIKEFSGSPEARLNPLDRSDIRNEASSFTPTESNFNYNSSCQFGVCLQNRDRPLFQKAQ